MSQSTSNYLRPVACLSFVCLLSLSFFINNAKAQTTVFSYQGKLTDSGNPANAAYDMQFKLFDAITGGAQIGSTLTKTGVQVTNGVFTLQLDFGVNAFSGADRFLEIGIRPASGGAFTTLAPRQQISSTPYAIRTLSATAADTLSNACVGCVQDAQINAVAGSKVSGAIPVASVPAGSANYVQNTTSQQAGANFNISGNGTAGSLNANGAVSLGGISPPAPVAGQGRIYLDAASNKVKISENGAAFVNLVGASGVSGSGTTNTIPLWSAGTTLGNSLITQANGGIQLPNSVQLATGAQGNNVGFGSPNSETGMTISGASGRVDLRFDGTLKLVASSSGIPLATNGIAITTAGNVGIGTTTPNGKLEVNAGGSGGVIRFHTPNAESGMSIIGTNRADVRFDGTTLKLLAGLGTTSPANGIAIDTVGNVGIGIFSPQTRLALSGGAAWTSAFWAGSLSMPNVSAFGWEANASGQHFGIGQTNGGLFFFRTNSGFNTSSSPANYDLIINDNGNLTQPLTGNGLVKAMLYVQQDGVILQCYNGISNSSTGDCGFTIQHNSGEGSYYIQFPFQVSNRFLSATARNPLTTQNGTFVAASFRFESPSLVRVVTFITSTEHIGGDEANFMLIIY